VAAALIAHSLALLADAAHMLTDVAALGMSAWAIRLSMRPSRDPWTYGWRRAEILSAALNGVALAAVALLIAVGAIQRLLAPKPVNGGIVLGVAVAGGIVNVFTTWALAKTNRDSLNMRGAYSHVVMDLCAFIGTAVAGGLIMLTGWERADAIASFIVVVLMGTTAWGLLRAHLCSVSHVLDVHDLHAWTLTSGSAVLAAHVVVEDSCFVTGIAPQVLDELQACLAAHFDVDHATFQLEACDHASHEKGIHP
jgi:cobalt-zinc-cadmium efflux system protein